MLFNNTANLLRSFRKKDYRGNTKFLQRLHRAIQRTKAVLGYPIYIVTLANALPVMLNY